MRTGANVNGLGVVIIIIVANLIIIVRAFSETDQLHYRLELFFLKSRGHHAEGDLCSMMYLSINKYSFVVRYDAREKSRGLLKYVGVEINFFFFSFLF